MATTDEFGIYISQAEAFEVVTGPGTNQVTLVNVAAHPEAFDVVVDIDPVTGGVTVPKQVALNYNNFGSTQYGDLSWEASGGSSGSTPGNCIGIIDFTATYTVGAGSFGTFRTVFEKQ